MANLNYRASSNEVVRVPCMGILVSIPVNLPGVVLSTVSEISCNFYSQLYEFSFAHIYYFIA